MLHEPEYFPDSTDELFCEAVALRGLPSRSGHAVAAWRRCAEAHPLAALAHRLTRGVSSALRVHVVPEAERCRACARTTRVVLPAVASARVNAGIAVAARSGHTKTHPNAGFACCDSVGVVASTSMQAGAKTRWRAATARCRIRIVPHHNGRVFHVAGRSVALASVAGRTVRRRVIAAAANQQDCEKSEANRRTHGTYPSIPSVAQRR